MLFFNQIIDAAIVAQFQQIIVFISHEGMVHVCIKFSQIARRSLGGEEKYYQNQSTRIV